MEKPTGTYRCFVCEKLWDGSEVIEYPTAEDVHLTCGDAFCGASVIKISDEPKKRAKE